jgi:putative peptide zinc metalloprotease protein
MTAATGSPSAPILPELRQELRLFAGPRDGQGLDWLIYDPIRHRYFQLSRSAFELLECWRAEPAAAFAERAAHDLARDVPMEHVNELARFLIANNLVLEPPSGDPRSLAAQEARARHSPIARLAHNYLFFKVPLVRPARFLAATMPLVEPLFSRWSVRLIALIWIAGIYLVSRQWDVFVSTFMDFLSLEGMMVYGVTLVLIKALHELSHAYTATRKGVRVNTMGVAFVVMTPILYTDVTDAWRLRKRRDKLAIDAAGVIVELALAGIALFLWAFTPDGPVRSALFVTATTSLAMGLLVNLNPLMRFDGYHLLADAWRKPNLQPRSNALACWWLREFLFAIDQSPPESLPRRTRGLLIAYAIAVWIYRFFLFLGIALVVYHMFFKALGVVLFAIEIIWFIALPMLNEMKEWWKMRAEIIKTRRTAVSALVLAVAIGSLVVPWQGTVAVQGVATSDIETRIFAPRPARIASISIADAVKVDVGDKLVTLDSPDLTHEMETTRTRIALTRVRLQRIAGDTSDRANRAVLEGELARLETALSGILTEQARLVIRAPHEGTVRDMDRALAVGEWIDGTTPIGRIVAARPPEVEAYIREEDLWRIAEGATAQFMPEDPLMLRRSGHVRDVSMTGANAIELPYLASVYGGDVPSDRTHEQLIKPRSGWHFVRITLEGAPLDQAVRGTVHIRAARESYAAVIWRRVLRVLVREGSA